MHFVGDVERGLASHCFCATCGSALVARKGDLRDWHFAHVAGQERPECIAGAMNLLRRLAIEDLNERGIPTLPGYSELVSVGQRPFGLSEWVRINAPQIVGVEWLVPNPKGLQVAVLRTSERQSLGLFVEEGESGIQSPAPEEVLDGSLLVVLPAPLGGSLVTAEEALAYIRRTIRLRWMHWSNAAEAAHVMKQALNERIQKLVRPRGQFPPVATGAAPPDVCALPGEEPSLTSFESSPDPVTAPWDIWRHQGGTLFFYVLTDGSSWVLVEDISRRWVIVPWPLFDGWDEAFPRSMGVPDPSLPGLVTSDMRAAMAGLAARSAAMFNDSLTGAVVAKADQLLGHARKS